MAKAIFLPFLLSHTDTAQIMRRVEKIWMSTAKGIRSAAKLKNKQITQEVHGKQCQF